MEKIKNWFLNFVKTRTIAYYIAAAATLIAWLAGVVASGALGFAGATACARKSEAFEIKITYKRFCYARRWLRRQVTGLSWLRFAEFSPSSWGNFRTRVCLVSILRR